MNARLSGAILCLLVWGCTASSETGARAIDGAATAGGGGAPGDGQTSASVVGGGGVAGTAGLGGHQTVPVSSPSGGLGGTVEMGGGGASAGSTSQPALGGSEGIEAVSEAEGGASGNSAGAGGSDQSAQEANEGLDAGAVEVSDSEGGVSQLDEEESKFLIFLLIGQSNMEGAPQPEAQDRTEDPRIEVLAYDTCSNTGRNYNEWYTASPPLHSCSAGVGPGDYFAKTLIESLPDGYTIGLVPLGVNGAPIDVFRKDVPRPGWELPPDNHWETGFEWIVSRAELAAQRGQIRGILFHQGESDAGQAEWVDKVVGLVSDLRTDLQLGDAPFLAGEVYHDGASAEHNALVSQLPERINNAHIISAEGLAGTDIYHFDLPSQRELGRRYAAKMIELLGL